MAGGRLVFLAGNHDHHLVHRDEENRLEAALAEGPRRGTAPPPGPAFFQAFLERRCPGSRSRSPTRPTASATSSAPTATTSTPRPPQRLARRPAPDPDALGDRRRRPGGTEVHRGLRVGDHPADRVALHRRPDAARHPRPAERLPRRPAGGPARLGGGAPVRGAERLAARLRDRGSGERRRARCRARSTSTPSSATRPRRQAREQPLAGPPFSRPLYPEPTVISRSDPSEHALEAFAQVVENLGWGERGGEDRLRPHPPAAGRRPLPAPASPPATGTPAPGSTSPTSARARPTPATCATPGPAPRS